MNQKQIDEMQSYDWWHSIDLGEGITTPGRDMEDKINLMGFPKSLVGLSVLDIGALDGLFSFEAEKLGAKYVLATDCESWTGERHGNPKTIPYRKSFEFAKAMLNSKVEDKTINVYDITPENVGTFNVVLFLGVFYHLWHPMLALENIAKVNNDVLIINTALRAYPCEHPVMGFCKGSYNGDTSNWWYPNQRCIQDMIEVVGYRKQIIIGGGDEKGYITIHAFKNQDDDWGYVLERAKQQCIT